MRVLAMWKKAPVLALVASAASVMAASLCCLLPVGAMVLGLGGVVGAEHFAKWRPVLLALGLILLSLAWYFTCRKPVAACAQGKNCGTSPFGRWNKLFLSLSTVLLVAIAAFRIWSGAVARYLEPRIEGFTGGSSSGLLTFRARIPSMDCEACTVLIQRKIRAQPGIVSILITFKEREAIVKYDPGQIAAADIVKAINETGFKVESANKEDTK
jgi:mercuric ion transport protein